MTRMEKNALYDEACNLCSEYEEMCFFDKHDTLEIRDYELENCETFYKMLARIVDNWEEITGEDA